MLVPLVGAALLWMLGVVHAATADPGRRGTPPPPPGEGGYAFLVDAGGSGPVAFDPCTPVHWVVRADGEPPGGREAVTAAFAEVGRATGLTFVLDGTTDEAPSRDRPRRHARYGDRWAPVLVAWATEEEVPDLSGPTVGQGVASWVGSPARLVTGQLLLDAADLTGDDGRLTELAAPTALHELAHVVGLGHVEDPHQLLHPVMTGRTGFGDGDLRGLHALGSSACR